MYYGLPHKQVLELWFGLYMKSVVRPIAMDYEAIADAMEKGERQQLDEMLKRFFYREPSPAMISELWLKRKDSLLETLRFGSQLSALDGYVDCSPIYNFCQKRGRNMIAARNPGARGWLAKNCPEVKYKTAMGCKTIADRTRRACGLPHFVPLDWVFEDQESFDEARGDFYDIGELRKARAKLLDLLRNNSNSSHLLSSLDDILGLQRRKLSKPRKKMSRRARNSIERRSIDRLLRIYGDKFTPANLMRLAKGFERLAKEKRR